MIYGDGVKTLVTHAGEMIVKAGPDVLGREPHYGRVCPEGVLDQITRRQ